MRTCAECEYWIERGQHRGSCTAPLPTPLEERMIGEPWPVSKATDGEICLCFQAKEE